MSPDNSVQAAFSVLSNRIQRRSNINSHAVKKSLCLYLHAGTTFDLDNVTRQHSRGLLGKVLSVKETEVGQQLEMTAHSSRIRSTESCTFATLHCVRLALIKTGSR